MKKDVVISILNLIKVKSIWSIGALAMFIYLTVTEKITGEVSLAIITSIVTYYFTKKDTTTTEQDEFDPAPVEPQK